jgi:hypothetical protein
MRDPRCSTWQPPPWKNGEKWCWRCEKFLAPTAFTRSSKTADGYLNWCKECDSTRLARYKKPRTDAQRAWGRRNYYKNHHKWRDRVRRHYLKTRTRQIQKAGEWRRKNLAHVRELKRIERTKWTEEQRAREKTRVMNWLHRNPDARALYRRKRRANKGSQHFTNAEWRALCLYYGNRCLSCGEIPPRLEADRVVPLIKGGSDLIDNIQPLCGTCNKKKYTSTIDYRTNAKAA